MMAYAMQMVSNGRVSGMSSEGKIDKEQADEKTVGNVNANNPVTGAVTLAQSWNICGQPLMTASNPAANAAAPSNPSFVVVKTGS